MRGKGVCTPPLFVEAIFGSDLRSELTCAALAIHAIRCTAQLQPAIAIKAALQLNPRISLLPPAQPASAHLHGCWQLGQLAAQISEGLDGGGQVGHGAGQRQQRILGVEQGLQAGGGYASRGVRNSAQAASTTSRCLS